MIERSSYIEKIRPFINTPVIKVLTGIRRCGKSVLMELIQQELIKTGVRKEQILSLNFESKTDERVFSESAWLSAVKALPGDKKRYLFFDEVQEFSDWEKVVNALLIDFDTDIYITGSNAKLLSGELATYLGGRYVEIKVYPFSFREVVSLVQEKGFADASLSPKELFLRYLKNGGFPFIYNYNFDENGVHQYLSSLYDSIVLKDISERHTVRDVAGLKQLLFFLISETGHPFSSSSLIKYLKNQKRTISTETIYNYIDYAKESCLLHLVNRQNMQGKEILRTQGKIYLTDHGLRETLYGNNMRDIDQVLENIVYMELLRRTYDVTVGISGSREIDFVAEKSGQKMYVQVCYLLASEETVGREFGVLEQIRDNFPKYVLSMDDIDRSRNGIIHKNIVDFLLEE